MCGEVPGLMIISLPGSTAHIKSMIGLLVVLEAPSGAGTLASRMGRCTGSTSVAKSVSANVFGTLLAR